MTTPPTNPIVTAAIGNNGQIFPNILELYSNELDMIADVTYGMGRFWRNVDVEKYFFYPSDIATGIDYNHLPYKDGVMDMVVLDPPYMGHNGGEKYAVARNYNVNVPKYNKDYIPNLYYRAIAESNRVLKRKGTLVLKCQDEIQSGRQNMNHVTIIQHCNDNGYRVEDMFIVVQKNTPIMRHPYQIHARKNHIYFIVFSKVCRR